MAKVLPFPLARRRGLIRRQAEFIAGLSAAGGESHIRRQVEIQRQALASKGVPEAVVAAECASLEAAIRAELWRVVIMGEAG